MMICGIFVLVGVIVCVFTWTDIEFEYNADDEDDEDDYMGGGTT